MEQYSANNQVHVESNGLRSDLTFDSEPASIAVIGVGGGGCNALMRIMSAREIPGVKYITVNTDIKSLRTVQGSTSIQIGARYTNGLGAGGNPELGQQAAETDRAALKRALGEADLVFVAAGMGGGTGTGAAPTVAEVAKSTNALVIGVVTTPFSWEGSRRADVAMSGIHRLREKVDNLIVIHNDRLLQLLDHQVTMQEALRTADEAVMLGILAIAELVNVPGQINVDLADVRTVMSMPGRALMALSEERGPNAALEAAKTAVRNPLLDCSIDGAQGVLFCVTGGPRLTLGEVNAAGEFIASRVSPEAMIFFGMVDDEEAEDRVQLTIVATGVPDQA